MSISGRSHHFSMLRRIPMPLLSILIGLFCGLLLSLVLEMVQPKAVQAIFLEELEHRLDQQAGEALIRFDSYVAVHRAAIRLLANHRRLANYLKPVFWFDTDDDAPIIHRTRPGWLPTLDLWHPAINSGYILLLDGRGKVREIYQEHGEGLSREWMELMTLYLSKSQDQAYITTLQGEPYLLVSEIAEDASGIPMGTLMLVAHLDDEFMAASQRGVSSSSMVVVLLDTDEQRFLASSDSSSLPAGSRMEDAVDRYVVTSQLFFDYEGPDLNMQFATLILRSVMQAASDRVLGLERRQRLVTAAAFVIVFTLLFYLLSQQLNHILRRLSLFSRRALGLHQPIIEQGSHLFVLEDWIKQFIRLVREARDEMHQRHVSEMWETEALKQAIMEAAPDSIITIDEAGRIIEFNPATEQIFGYRRDQMIGQGFAELMIEKESRSTFLELLAGYVSSGESGDGGGKVEEIKAIRPGGEVFLVDVTIKPIQLQECLVFTVYLYDISQRERRKQEILSLAKFPSESPSPVLRINRPGVILYANAASHLLFEYWGCRRSQTLPLYWRNRVLEVLESGKVWETEVDCGEHIYSLLLTPVIDLDYVNIYGRDITAVRLAEGKAREHQQELVHVCRLSSMGEMSTGLAHELNQPLSAIINFAGGCIRRLESDIGGREELVEALKQISNQARRAGEIIHRLRGLVVKQAPVRNQVDLNEVVREACSFVEFEVRKNGLSIEQELSPERLPVCIDVVQIEQVLLNFIRNALDAMQETPQEERCLTVRTGRAGETEVMVEVLDAGTGIDDEVMLHLFDPFFTTKQTGMGMGLAISQTIVEDHGGKISVSSGAKEGTRFTIRLLGENE